MKRKLLRTRSTVGGKASAGAVMRPAMRTLFASLGAVLMALFCAQVFAQMDTGGVTGTVKDPSGAVVVGAKCTLTNNATNVAQTAISTSAGAYTFTGVPAGTYTLRVTAHGFKEYVLSDISVHVQSIVTADVPLEIGSVDQQVTVTSSVPLLQAQDASVGMTINSKMTNDLPLQGGGSGRDFRSLAQLAPGVYSNGNPSSNTIFASGVENGQVDVRFNGVNDNLEFYGGTTILPIPDAIQEFKFMNGNNSAEFGHSTGAILNAITYSGTNQFHGHVWEYFQNDYMNANDYFNKLNKAKKPMLRHNEFGGLIGGPVMLPHYNGRNRTFFFFDFQRTLQTSPNQYTSTVPTKTMQDSKFTDMQDLLALNKSTHTDALNRKFQYGTIFDPATTRHLAPGQIDPVTGLPNLATDKNGNLIEAWVRDPFYNCTTAGCALNDGMAGNTTKDYTTAAQLALLNTLPNSRLDPYAVALLQLLPLPNTTSTNILQNNWFVSPPKGFNGNQYDGRIDEKINDKDSVWVTYSHISPNTTATTTFPGPAEGALQVNYATTNPSYMVVSSWTHLFSPNLINEFRFGVNNNYQTRIDPFANEMGLPEKFGVPGIPQIKGNGGLPVIHTGVISDFGAHRFAPTIQTARVFDFQDNFTRIFGKHEFKFGGQFDRMMANIIQPAYPRGFFQWNGMYSNIPNASDGETGMADMLLTPIPANSYYAGVGGLSTSDNTMGGLQNFQGSNWAQTNYHAPYIGVYVQDNWKFTPNVTANIGLRWDYFGAYASDGGKQANLIMGGDQFLTDGNGLGAYYLIGHDACNTNLGDAFRAHMAAAGIPIVCSYNNAVTRAQYTNFGPRVGLAWRIRPSLVARAGAGIAYGALDSVGYGGTLGTNYPFQFNYSSPSSNNSQTPLQLPGTTTTATMENAFAAVSLTDPTVINPQGMGLTGKNYHYQTPYTISLNYQLQWQFTSRDSIQAGYVATLGRHLDSLGPQHNQVYQMLPPGSVTSKYLPYPSLGTAAFQMTNLISSYNSLQAIYERRFADGSSLSTSYTFSKCLSDDFSKGGLGQGTRGAVWLPGMSPREDYGLCTADMTHIIKANGELAVPFGRGSTYFSNINAAEDAVIGGWRFNFILTNYSGLPYTVGCQNPSQGANYAGPFGCNAPMSGVDPYKGYKKRLQWANPAAFVRMPYNPVAAPGQNILSDLGIRGNQLRGPGLFALDASLHKQFDTGEGTKFEVRLEAMNALNHVAFNNPSNNNFLQTNPGQFGVITGDRTGARIVQLAAKFFF